MLTTESITFGKYKGFTLEHVLKDRDYCKWLLGQDWFENSYEYLYNRLKEYNPKDYFLKGFDSTGEFLNDYEYFNLNRPDEVSLPLTEGEKICYSYYLGMIDDLRNKIYDRMENEEENAYDIKAPTNWLKHFEKTCGIPRGEFKIFLSAYELPNIPYIVERIKEEGGLEYKGAKSFLIAKERSEEQEKWWEGVLKDRYGEELGAQFKYQNCIFDFLNISTNTIFECKLGLKDFCDEQYRKYKLSLDKYRIIYLIGRDGVINMEKKEIYTTNKGYYDEYLVHIPLMKEPSYLDKLIEEFNVVEVEDVSGLFGK